MNSDLNFLTQYGETYIKTQTNLAIATLKKYNTIVNKLIEFEKCRGEKILFKDVNLKLRSELIHYFSESHRLSNNTIGRYLKFIKSLCLDAKRHGIILNREVDYFKGYTIEASKTILTFDELNQIKSTNFTKPNHKTARDWLIIGCYTGQRVSDLLQMNSDCIQKIQNTEQIVLKQIKTGKLVQIPMHLEIKRILLKRNDEFPSSFAENFESNKSLFNRYLKQLCEFAKIDTIEKGSVYNSETKRNEDGSFEKYKLVSSHICRRSFATNFYGNPKYPTPLLMSITAHSTEKMFLEYIGKKQGDNDAQLSMF
ncbi:MAG: site-specific integrase [Flavobacteriaceae bacterium]|nr:site-specific integrase [Flavobacteriaceae bacterium]